MFDHSWTLLYTLCLECTRDSSNIAGMSQQCSITAEPCCTLCLECTQPRVVSSHRVTVLRSCCRIWPWRLFRTPNVSAPIMLYNIFGLLYLTRSHTMKGFYANFFSPCMHTNIGHTCTNFNASLPFVKHRIVAPANRNIVSRVCRSWMVSFTLRPP